MAFDAEFIDGFDKYGPIGFNPQTVMLAGEWTSLALSSGGGVSIVAGLAGPGVALKLTNGGSTSTDLAKVLGGAYARHIGGRTFSSNLVSQSGWTLRDTSTEQVAVTIESNGTIGFRRGGVTGTLVASSTQTVSANSIHFIEWDITVHSTAGIFIVWLDGVITSLNLTSQNTRSSTNNSFNTISHGLATSSVSLTVDNEYDHFFISSGSGDTALLDNPVVETQFPTSDSSVAFVPTTGVIGSAYSTVATTSAPGANELVLRPYTPGVAATINSVSIVPAATSGTANFKAVIYSDSAGAAHTLLSTGSAVTGCTSGTTLTAPLTTPQALSAGTQYWIGYITDTSIAIAEVDATTLGYKAANTYASGAPGTAPAMTGAQPSWQLWGNCTGLSTNYSQVSASPPLGDLSYNLSSTVNAEDLFGFPPLTGGSQNIATVAVKIYCERTDAGARTLTLQQKSSTTDSSGSAAAAAPGTTYGWMPSYYDTDPNGSIAWVKASVDAATAGYKIAS